VHAPERADHSNLASIGYHFGSKEALLDEALIVASARWLEPIVGSGRSDATRTLRERIADGLERFVESLESNQATAVAFFEAVTRTGRAPAVQSRLAESYQRLRDTLRDNIFADLSDTLGPAGSDALASAIIALYDGVLLQWLLDPGRAVNTRALIDTLGDSLRV
jgi:AcrR family transcriptional regulator